jgi:Ser/Thr protein kinase RdoA (MazF antagonist)
MKIDERLPWVRDPLPMDVQRRLRRARSLLEQARRHAPDTDAFQNGELLVLLHGDVAGGNLVWVRRRSCSTGSTPAWVMPPMRSHTASTERAQRK